MDDEARAIYRERGLGGAQERGTRPCLLVVDLSRGFTDPASPLGCDADLALDTVGELLDVAREHDMPRIFTRIEYAQGDLKVASAFLEKMPALASLGPGTAWAAIDERIAPAPGEPVLTKLFASAFWGTSLGQMLAAQRCDTVVVTGASTSGCVRATVVDALQHGYRVVVPRDAVADRARAPHEAALFDIQAKYGEVVDTPDALAVLRGASATPMEAAR